MKKLILSVSLMAFALAVQAGGKDCCKAKAAANADAKTCTAKAGATCSEKAGAMCKAAPSKKALLSPKDSSK